MTISSIKFLWEKEKAEYSEHEIGSGVQNFVNEVLMSPDIFNLKKGKLSTNDSDRKNEFLLERTKKRKRADAIIFISEDVVIPVEVEKYRNIKAGELQIFNYQKAWNRKYGILTDGFTWRFYNNKIIINQFTLDDIFENTNNFLTFWKEYTQLENYYLQFFEKTAETSEYEEDLNFEEKRRNFFSDITKLIDSFRKKLNLKAYFTNLPEREKEKKSVEISYSYFIQFILYKTLSDNNFHTFGTDFSLRLKRIHKDLEMKNYGDILFVIKTISKIISKNIYKPFTGEQKIIDETLEVLLYKAQNKLHEITPWLDIFVFIKKYNFDNIRNEIFGFIYENYLKHLYEDKNKGQYFTAPEIVDFMLDELGYSGENLSKKNDDEISIIDPSCGSGTFLYSAVRNIIDVFYKNPTSENMEKAEKLITENIFGLDIEAFPLYLAEMSIIMKMLPLIINKKYNRPFEKKIKVFKTRDSIAEFLDVAMRNTIYDIEIDKRKNKQQLSFFTNELNLGYSSYVRDEDNLKEMKQSLENHEEPKKIDRFRFDYVIGNPPYIDYNSCSKQKILFTQFIRSKKLSMSNIYGVNLNTVPGRRKAYAPKPNLYAFFTALGLGLLKKGGKICFIIPQTILIQTDLDVLRYYLAKYTTIEKIINFSGNLFVNRGLEQKRKIATSSLIFIVKKETPKEIHEVEIINYKKNNDIEKSLSEIKRQKNCDTKKILQHELLKKLSNWNFVKFNKTESRIINRYDKLNSFDFYRLERLSNLHFKSIFHFDKGLVFPKDKIKTKITNSENYFFLPDKNKNKYQLEISEQIIEEKYIRFPKGAQGIKVFEKKYKIIWRYMNTQKFYFSAKKIMINHNYIIISSDCKNEMLYLLSLLNAQIFRYIFQKLFKIENEKSWQIGIKAVKEFGRIPKITKSNRYVKEKIIEKTEELLANEKNVLSDFVNFNYMMMQEFDNAEVIGKNLVLGKSKKKYKLKILSDLELIKSKIEKFKNSEISLYELKNLEIIDFDKINVLKNYIDNLVFALYFRIKIPGNEINNIEKVKNICEKNGFYKVVSK